jgi:hypothetical protein
VAMGNLQGPRAAVVVAAAHTEAAAAHTEVCARLGLVSYGRRLPGGIPEGYLLGSEVRMPAAALFVAAWHGRNHLVLGARGGTGPEHGARRLTERDCLRTMRARMGVG